MTMKPIDTVLMWVTRLGVFLMPFIPLVISGTMFFPFITGKNFTFRIIVLVALAAYILLALRRPEYRPKHSYVLYALIAFLALLGIADAFGANPFKSFWSNFERMEGYVTLLHLGAYFIVAAAVLDSEKWWMRFWATSVGVSAFLGIYGILQLAGKIVINQGGVRLDGTFGNAAYFAGYMLFHFFLTIFLIFRHRVSSVPKWLYGGALLLQLFVLYFSATRGAFVGLAVGLMLALLLVVVLEKRNRTLRFGSLALGIALLLIGGLLYAGRDSDFVKHSEVLTRFASISVEGGAPRFMVWGMAVEGFKERPLLGWGQENFNFVFNKYYNPHMWGQEQWFDRTHDIFFDWLIAGGLLGLLSYLSLYAALLYYLWKKNDHEFSVVEKSVLTALIVAYFVQNIFVFDNIGTYILFFSLLAFMHSRTASPFRKLSAAPLLHSEASFYSAASAALVALVMLLYFVDIRNIAASTDLIYALQPHPTGMEANLGFFKKALSEHSFADQEIDEQITQAAATISGSAAVAQPVKDDFVKLALSSFTELIARVPDDARHRVFIGSLLNRLGRYDEALPHLETAHRLSPAKQTISFELASTYMSQGKFDDAERLLKGAFEEAPEYNNARIAYAAAAIYAKHPDVVAQVLVPAFGTVAVPDERLTKAYYDTKQYDKVLQIWKKRVADDPKNGKYLISLAAAYLLVGDRASSIAALQHALILLPDAKAQIEGYISEIRAGRNP